MNLSSRQRKIVSLLLKQVSYQSIDYYASLMDVSDKTIINDFHEIQDFLNILGYEIIRNGRRVRLEPISNVLTDDQKLRYEHLLYIFNCTEKRSIQIFKDLIINGNVFTYQELSESHFVSKTSIIEDIKFIRSKFLSDEKILISDFKGTRIIGKESEIQKSLTKYNDYILNKISETTLVQDFDSLFYSAEYGKQLFEATSSVLMDYVFENVESIDELYLDNILNTLIVMIYRLTKGYRIEDSHHFTKISIEDKHYADSENILRNIKSTISFEFGHNEVCFLMLHMHANKIFYDMHLEDYSRYIEKLIKEVSQILSINLEADMLLYKYLSNHFPSMIFRMKNGISIRNPFNKIIIDKYFLLNNIIWYAIQNISRGLGINFTQDEVSYLVMYFQLAVERFRGSKQVLIICPLGYSASTILESEVKRLLPPIDVTTVLSRKKLRSISLKDYDMIISTFLLEDVNIPQVVVSPLLTSSDKQNIMRLYQNHFLVRRGNFIKYSNSKIVENEIKEVRIYDDLKFRRKKDFFKFISTELVALGYIKEEYISTMKDREKINGTDFPSGVALPHGDPKYILETMICVFVNDKKFKWDEENVDVIILVLLNENSLNQVKKVYRNLYSIISNRETVEKLFIGREKEEIEKNIRSLL